MSVVLYFLNFTRPFPNLKGKATLYCSKLYIYSLILCIWSFQGIYFSLKFWLHAFVRNYVRHFYFFWLHYYIFHAFLSIIALQKPNAKEEMGKLSKVNNVECSLIGKNYSFILFLWIAVGQRRFLSWLCPFSSTLKYLIRYWWLAKSSWDMKQSPSFFIFLKSSSFPCHLFFSCFSERTGEYKQWLSILTLLFKSLCSETLQA